MRKFASRVLRLTRMFFSIFNESRRLQITYILRNYGFQSLIKTASEKVKMIMRGTKDTDPLLTTNEVAVNDNPYLKLSANSWSENNAKNKLNTFLSSDAILQIPLFSHPLVSVILLFYNRAEMSFQCLETLIKTTGEIPYEVVIVDNGSTDETPALLDHIKNAKVVRNPENRGFGGGCNQATDLADGKYLLFLNNDTQLMPNSIQLMLQAMEGSSKTGAVGGKLINPQGQLLEAGSIIWQDGSCLGFGRNDDPFKPEYSYVKDVDFCSGALLLTPRDLFLSMGKFDPIYYPAYYEDADYCLKLWSKGYRVLFQPLAVAIHHEFGSLGVDNSIVLQVQNQKKFFNKWKGILKSHLPYDAKNIIFSREHISGQDHILVIDDQIPDYRLGNGFPRTYQILQTLKELGYGVTFLPLQKPELAPEITQSLQKKGIEVIHDDSNKLIDVKKFLESRLGYYKVVFVSRPHNMQDVKNFIKQSAPGSTIIYDAEALFSSRQSRFKELIDKSVTDSEKEKLIQMEVSLTKNAEILTTVSQFEKDQFEKYGAINVHILGHSIEPQPTPAPFDQRKDILFIGGILGSPSPNEDSVLYFVNQIFPLVRKVEKCEFHVVGTNRVKGIWELDSDLVHIIGKVDDLTPYYNRCRLFVAPTRYSAGIPLKMIEAAAFGLPAVVTPLISDQLGWIEDRDLLIGRNPQDFADKVVALYTDPLLFMKLRQNALDRVRIEYSPKKFKGNLKYILDQATSIKHP